MVPHLLTALHGPLSELEQRILESAPAIERWFRLEWMEHSPAVYSQVTLRNAGHKIVPVDTVLFPSDWHHLSAAMLPLAVQAAQAAIEKFCPDARNLLIVPRNGGHLDVNYLESLAKLRHIFAQAGLHVRFGSVDPEVTKSISLKLPSGDNVVFEPALRVRGRLQLKHFDPCTILLNTDLREGIPGILEDLNEQHVLPPLALAWPTRRRAQFALHYEEICKRFGKMLGIDPWLIYPLEETIGAVDLAKEADISRVATHVDSVLGRIRRKCKEYGIVDRPFVCIKLDNGDDSLGVLTVRDANELPPPSPEAPHRAELIVQEGVASVEHVDHAVSETVVCTIDRYVVGGFHRFHAEHGTMEPLAGDEVQHQPLAFAQWSSQDHVNGSPEPNRFYMYGVIARLAMLASSYELEAADPDAETFQ